MLRTLILTAVAAILLVPGRAFADPDASVREFLGGQRSTFSSKGHPKARGANFTIAYPSSWAASEGDRPNVLQKFTSEGGSGLETITIVTAELPLPPGTSVGREERETLFSAPQLREMLPPGATFVGAQATEIEDEPAGILEYTMRVDRAGMSVHMHTCAISFLLGTTFVQIQLHVAGLPGSEAEVANQMSAWMPLFTLVANSIVFPDKWNLADRTSSAISTDPDDGGALGMDDPATLMLVTIVSIVITWSIGLAPPLLIRYAIVRRPLGTRRASWIAAALSVFFWIAFLLLHLAVGEKPGTGVVWLIMFFVSRWIMSRGYARTATQDLQALGATVTEAQKAA